MTQRTAFQVWFSHDLRTISKARSWGSKARRYCLHTDQTGTRFYGNGCESAIRVHLAGIPALSEATQAAILPFLLNRRVHIDVIGHNKQRNSVEAWVWIRRQLRKDSISHRLARLGMAEIGPIPSEGFRLTTGAGLTHEGSLRKAAGEMSGASWKKRLWWKIRPPKF